MTISRRTVATRVRRSIAALDPRARANERNDIAATRRSRRASSTPRSTRPAARARGVRRCVNFSPHRTRRPRAAFAARSRRRGPRAMEDDRRRRRRAQARALCRSTCEMLNLPIDTSVAALALTATFYASHDAREAMETLEEGERSSARARRRNWSSRPRCISRVNSKNRSFDWRTSSTRRRRRWGTAPRRGIRPRRRRRSGERSV